MVPCLKTGFFLGEKKCYVTDTTPTRKHPVHLSAIVLTNVAKPKAGKVMAQARNFSYQCYGLAAVNSSFLNKTGFIQICTV